MVNLQGDGTLKKIQDDYLYWDKIKHTKKNLGKLWNAVHYIALLEVILFLQGKKYF
jgi:hypothetical protein